jgi:hypothetical protein
VRLGGRISEESLSTFREEGIGRKSGGARWSAGRCGYNGGCDLEVGCWERVRPDGGRGGKRHIEEDRML